MIGWLMNTEKAACFFGHRKITVTKELKENLYKEIETLIVANGITTFLFGSKSQFNDLCLTIVSDLKNKYPSIQRIYVRAEFAYIDEDYKAYLLENYEDTYFPEKIIGAGKAIYVERNYEMIDKSSVCVVYYDENYLPPRRNQCRRALTDYQPSSGTKLAFKYALSKNRKIINVFTKD